MTVAAHPHPGPGPHELDVHVAPMRRRHLRAVLRIEGQVYPRPWSLGLFMSELALRGSRVYLVARVGGDVLGYGGLMFSGADAHVTTLAVDPAWQRRKIATRLLLTLVRTAVARGAEALTLEVRMSNHAAQQLYRAFGLVPAGVRKNYYVEVNEDALVMWATDIQSPAYAGRLDTIEAGLGAATVVEGVQ